MPGVMVPGVIVHALARIYGWGVARRNKRFDRGVGVTEFDRPVISVGNLSVGGTGKTPLVASLIAMLREGGHWPCVAMRGYGQRDGERADEAREYRARFPDLPMVVRPDRTSGLLELFHAEAGERVDCVVLDDGFQHRCIARQLDIVLLDATRSPFEDALLPAGWLREPVSSLQRARAGVITHAEHVSGASLQELVERTRSAMAPGALVCVTEHAWDGLVQSEPGPTLPVSWLRGKRVFVCCAIGNPDAFLAQVDASVRGRASAGTALADASPLADFTVLAGSMVLRDHDPYEPATIRKLLDQARAARAEAIVVTEKDWVKLTRVKPEAWPCPVVRPRLAIRCREGEAALREMVMSLARDFARDE
jgi:tetraacyldisaccharide 4'-kinase